MPNLRILQTPDAIETPNGRIIVDQPSVKTVKAMVTHVRHHSFGVDSESVAGLTSQLPQDFLHVHTAEEFGFFAHQVKQYVFALGTDCG